MFPRSLIHRQLVDDLRANVLTLPEFLWQVEAQFEQYEPSVLAFVPEEDRFKRLHEDADTLLMAYPDLIKRPRMFAALVGVKDIFHVEGFITQAGSRLPAEVLQ